MRWGGWLRSCLLTLHALLVSRASQPNAPALHAAAYGGDAPAQSMRVEASPPQMLEGWLQCHRMGLCRRRRQHE